MKINWCQCIKIVLKEILLFLLTLGGLAASSAGIIFFMFGYTIKTDPTAPVIVGTIGLSFSMFLICGMCYIENTFKKCDFYKSVYSCMDERSAYTGIVLTVLSFNIISISMFLIQLIGTLFSMFILGQRFHPRFLTFTMGAGLTIAGIVIIILIRMLYQYAVKHSRIYESVPDVEAGLEPDAEEITDL